MTPGERETLDNVSNELAELGDLLALCAIGLMRAAGSEGPPAGDANALTLCGKVAHRLSDQLEMLMRD